MKIRKVREKSDINANDLLKRGFAALVKELGAAGAIRFMMPMLGGKGDYTKERRKWVDKMTWEDIQKGLEEMRQNNE